MRRWLTRVAFGLTPVLVVVTTLVTGAQLAPAARLLRPLPARVPTVRVVVSSKQLGRVSPYLFGANLLWPYDAEGAFDASDDQFYPAFVTEVDALGVSALRYPAGITSDSFDWERAIGPMADRQLNEPYGVQSLGSKPGRALDGPVPSAVGPDEFGRLLDQTGAVGTITVNFASGTPEEAADFVAYMTAPYTPRPSRNPGQPSYWAALRARNGHRAPYDVPYWEVGNEQDGRGQFGWRSGELVSVGHHKTRCTKGETAVCLYAFGGTTAFFRQRVGTFADQEPGASRSSGLPGQVFYAYFPPVVPKTEAVFVDGRKWAPVTSFSRSGPRAHVYELDPESGRIRFGNGRHGAIPPAGDQVTLSYQSGPHGGFVQFYAAMKKMGPGAHICEAEESNTIFLQVMGKTYPYDCVEVHKYAKPLDIRAPMALYEERLLAMPGKEGQQVAALQGAIRRYSGRNVPVVLTEYGQLVEPMPVADPDFNLSLDEGLLVALQLTQWIDHNLPLAEKYLLNSAPFLGGYRLSSTIDVVGLSVNSAMIAAGPPFIVEPTGETMRLVSQLGGGERVATKVVNDPWLRPGDHLQTPVLQCVAAWHGRVLDLLVVNTSPTVAVRAEVSTGRGERSRSMLATVLDGPNALAYNTLSHPGEVTTLTRYAVVPAKGNFRWTFPAHSVTLLQFDRT
jgi:alpha-N-arabinofuranosidase